MSGVMSQEPLDGAEYTNHLHYSRLLKGQRPAWAIGTPRVRRSARCREIAHQMACAAILRNVRADQGCARPSSSIVLCTPAMLPALGGISFQCGVRPRTAMALAQSAAAPNCGFTSFTTEGNSTVLHFTISQCLEMVSVSHFHNGLGFFPYVTTSENYTFHTKPFQIRIGEQNYH